MPAQAPQGASEPAPPQDPRETPSLAQIARAWGRIGCLGFGGPPAHIALLRELCVERRRWLSATEFERAIAASNLLPGPASTQLAIYCAWRLRGAWGALVGGLCFIVPGLLAILALAALFLSSSAPLVVRGAGMGAGAAVAAVAARAGRELGVPLWERTARPRRPRVLAYAIAGALAAALLGPWLVLVLLACGALELGWERRAGAFARLPAALPGAGTHRRLLPGLALASAQGGTLALVWTALKVGALAFGGGFVIIPLMQADAVGTYHWMTHAQFLDAVALGQVTPGPVVQTVAVVGYAAGGVPAGLLAATVAFSPSFAFVLVGGPRYQRLLANERVQAFLVGAAPAAAGAIVGAAVPLARALPESWQYGVLGAAAVALLALRRGVVSTLVLAGLAGVAAVALGAPAPH